MKKSILLLIAPVLLLSGCVTVHDFSSNTAPGTRVTLKAKEPVEVYGLDGQSRVFGITATGGYVAYLAPGQHSLEIHYQCQPAGLIIADAFAPPTAPVHTFVSAQPQNLQFTAVPGHTYSLVGQDGKGRWNVFIDDITSPAAPVRLPVHVEGTLVLNSSRPY